jgi:hypothetical protein
MSIAVSSPAAASSATSSVVGNGKRLALCISFALILAVLSPLPQNWTHRPKDNFPLSYYPMFSAKREPIETFYYVLGFDAEGTRMQLRHNVIGNGGENQVRRGLRKTINAGLGPELARDVARRLAQRTGRRYRDVVSVSVCRGKYSVDDWFHGKQEPVSERVYGTASVDRTQTP